MQLPATYEDLVEKANDKGLYKKLVKQLNKDFKLANIDLGYDEEILPNSLKLLLEETVYHLINEEFTNFLNLLYIIDISENKIRKLDNLDPLQFAEEVTFLILLREWQKIWYRSKY